MILAIYYFHKRPVKTNLFFFTYIWDISIYLHIDIHTQSIQF